MAFLAVSCWASILVGGASHSLTGMSRLPSSSLDAARKWPMLVMHEPMNTSSILVPATSDKSLASSGSFGQHSTGSLRSARSISMTCAYSASLSASSKLGAGQPGFNRLDAALQRALVGIAVGDHVLHQRDVAGEVFLDRCGVELDGAPGGRALGRSVDSSNACSTFRSGSPSISRMRPENSLTLPCLATVSRPCLMA
jgi:hypothetical protein